MRPYHMRPTAEIERCLQRLPAGLRDIVLELRSLIVLVAPTATERIQRKGFTYYDQARGGSVSAGICQIGLERDHIRLAFIHGAFLPDSTGLLEGPAKYKRYVRLYSYEQTPWDDLKDLIAASARFDPYAWKARSESAEKTQPIPVGNDEAQTDHRNHADQLIGNTRRHGGA
jgi:hypothetical protein